ncbi:MAG: ester cyclase [Chloroflexi bacterium]|nr:ester cyclase [Chloroflexota bacterium]
MSEENKAKVRRFIEEVWNKGNLDVIEEYCSPDFVGHEPGSPEGVQGCEGQRHLVTMYRTAFPDAHWNIDDIVAEGDKVTRRITATGTQSGDLPDIPATGKRATVTMISVDRFEGDKVVETWTEWDRLGMMQQLGVIPEPAQAS